MKFKLGQNTLELSTHKTEVSSLRIIFSFADKLLPRALATTTAKPFAPLDDITDLPCCIPHYSATKPNIIVNLGQKTKFNLLQYTKALGLLADTLKSNRKITTVDIVLEEEISKLLKFEFAYYTEQTIFNLINGLYYFDELKSSKQKLHLTQINLVSSNNIKKALEDSLSLLDGVFLIKHLGNNPANITTPTYLADTATSMAKLSKKVKVEIIDEKGAKKLKMHSFLAVAQGSNEEAKFITMSYSGGKSSEKPIVLVGKGVTFDSGGISLKPGRGMEDMKYDMLGAATVLGVFLTVTKLNLPINLTVVAPCTENMPSGRAIKPGDVVKSMAGTTIEINNTDAEGRLILCDALTYVKRYKPELVIDMATLTGACVTALGSTSAMYSNDDNLANLLTKSSQNTNDKIWRMPLFDEYEELLRNSVADLSNIAGWGGVAGSVTAAKFLESFTSYKWAHIDIAGTAYKSGYNGKNSNGATGRPFYLLIDFLRNYKN